MQPVLSIGIIFKNEIRCLERCVKSLRLLRDAVPCELVMADTGSDDGSRAVAEKYADILFDFPWINDFAAARNAVMDRCSGEWYFTIDADEWLGGDVARLIDFLGRRELWTSPFCGVTIRNYLETDLSGDYTDFFTSRILRMSTGVRFAGAIHERLTMDGNVTVLDQVILHHDGYVPAIWDQRDKAQRNMELLREAAEENPDDLRVLLECVESAQGTPSCEEYVRKAAAAVERRVPGWERFGPPILRFAVLQAAGYSLPELERWSSELLEWFPDSIFTRVDGVYGLFMKRVERREYAQAIPLGEQYLENLAQYRAGGRDFAALGTSSLAAATHSREEDARVTLADACFQEGQLEKARETLLSVDPAAIPPGTVGNYVKVMMNLHTQGDTDLSPALAELWEKNGPERERGAECRKILLEAAQVAFSPAHQAAEDEKNFRHAWTLFLPLAGKCEVGSAARILASQTAEEAQTALEAVEDWTDLPVSALAHALETGVSFPPPERELNLEVLDNLAARLAAEPGLLERALDRAAAHTGTPQTLAWADRLALAAIQSCRWADGAGDGAQGETPDKPRPGEENEAKKLALARTFGSLEGKFLPLCYAAEAPLFVLPPLHRFGRFCARAFDALEAGDPAGYVRALRQGLEACGSVKPLVEFLLDHTPELQTPPPSPELLALADQVRTMLAAYPADDPAVAALKASPVYRRVAYLIEGGDGA